MTRISELPRDLVEDVLSRVPVTSLKAVRFTCTKWNTFSEDESFIKKHIAQAKAVAKKKQMKEFLVVMKIYSSLHIMSVNTRALHNVESSIQTKGTLISLNNGDPVIIYKVFHCDGVLLCLTTDIFRLVVWNPYSGQTRWIKPRNALHWKDKLALGYEMKNKSHRNNKILRFSDTYAENVEFEIYDFDSNSWKVVEVTQPGWIIPYYSNGVTLKGNTYWYAYEPREISKFLLCFDFTTERFVPRLPLPFKTNGEDTVTHLSSVREEQLAVLVQHGPMGEGKIWISNKIEPNAVSWGTKLFLQFCMGFTLPTIDIRFFVDQKNKVAVVFNNHGYRTPPPERTQNIAYILGEDGYFKMVNLRGHMHAFSSVCFYVPSSVQVRAICTMRQKEMEPDF